MTDPAQWRTAFKHQTGIFHLSVRLKNSIRNYRKKRCNADSKNTEGLKALRNLNEVLADSRAYNISYISIS